MRHITPVQQDASKEVARQLLETFLGSQGMNPGERLPSERDLAGAFGVGRSAIREALKTLSFLGVVDIRPGAGTYLLPPDGQFLPQVFAWGLLLGERRTMDLVEARALLEASIAELAAERRDDKGLEALRTHLSAMEQEDTDDYIEADIAFHLELARCTNNEVLFDVLSNIQSLLRAWMRRVVDAQGVGDSVDQHRRVLEAVIRRDPEAARAAMHAHMASARRRLDSTIPPTAEA